MSDRPVKLIVGADGSQQYIPLSDEEIAEREAMAAQAAIEQAEREAAEAQKAADKASAIEKLTELGLTESEINALIG